MPDYDPDQEDSVYDSTPDPETESTTSLGMEHSSEDKSSIQRYAKLHMEENSSAEEISGKETKSQAPSSLPKPVVETTFCYLNCKRSMDAFHRTS